jgi:hypothetical protein
MSIMKLKLDNEAIAQEFFEDSLLIGVVAPVKDYQFVWQVNQVLGFNFKMSVEKEIELLKKGRKYFYAVFEYDTPGSTVSHYLYNNQHEGEYLLSEFEKQRIDFIWLVKGYGTPVEDQAQIIAALKEIAGVQAAFVIGLDKVKNKQHLFF